MLLMSVLPGFTQPKALAEALRITRKPLTLQMVRITPGYPATGENVVHPYWINHG
jgi:hypothetical protein